jgi:hypothetical protein
MSEDRLHLHLTRIETRLDKLIAQAYTKAMGQGVRLLADAADSDGGARLEEIAAARALFLDAAASTDLPLEISVAERYVMLCSLALDLPSKALTAFRRSNRKAFDAILQAGEDWENARTLAEQRVGPAPSAPAAGESAAERAARQRTEDLVAREVSSIRTASIELADLAVAAFCETNALADFFGQVTPSRIVRAPDEALTSLYGTGYPAEHGRRWLVELAPGTNRASVGELTFTWDTFVRVAASGEERMLVPRIPAEETPQPGEPLNVSFLRWLDRYFPRTLPLPDEYYLLEATVQAQSGLPVPVRATLVSAMERMPIPGADARTPASPGIHDVLLRPGEQNSTVATAYKPRPPDADGGKPSPPAAYLAVSQILLVSTPPVADPG